VIFARIISLLFHPLLLATYLFSLFAFLFPVAFEPIREDAMWKFIMLVFCFTFVLPALNVGLFRSMGTITSVTMRERKERTIPFFFIMLLYGAVTFLFYDRNEVSLNDNFLKFLLVIDALVFVSAIITLFYKISVHSIAAWGFIGILLPLNGVSETGVFFYPTVISIAMAGVIMSARLKLHVHTLREVAIGSMVGLGTGVFMMNLLFRY